MRVAITGGLGFVGLRVARELLASGDEVTLLDVATSTPHPLAAAVLPRAKHVACDLTDAGATRAALADVDAVFHAAAFGTKVERERPAETLALNLTGTASVLEGARRGGAQRLVLASSAVVYGEGDRDGALDEAAAVPPAPTIYAATKLAGEHLVAAYREQFGLSGVALRFMNVYGYQPPDSPQRDVVPRVLERIAAGQAPVIHGDGSSTYDFVHVDDVARAVVLALRGDAGPGPVNIGTGIETSIAELIELLLAASGSPLRPERHPEVVVPRKRYRAATARAEEMLGFRAAIGLADGLARTVAEQRAETSRARAA